MDAMTQSDEHKRVIANISQARSSRSHFAPLYNAFYELALPDRLRVDHMVAKKEPRPATDQDSLFDNTLQQAAHDFASDFADEFTPSYRAWTKHEITNTLPKQYRKQVDEYIQERSEKVFSAIRESSFDEAAQDAYLEMAIAPAAVYIPFSRAGQPINCEFVPVRELLILPGPFGNVGHRYREHVVLDADLDIVYPHCSWNHVKPSKKERQNSKGCQVVVEGGYRLWDKPVETWRWFVIHRNKVIKEYTHEGVGSCPLQVGRIFVSKPSAYGGGPGKLALSPSRALNEMAYLELKRAGKIVDPAGIFVDPAGVFNPDQGFDAGQWYEAGPGFEHVDLTPQGDIREVFLKREDLRMSILRAMFQDKPYQRGDTPPSATQWAGEEAASQKRKALPRSRIHSEWVLPIIQRFEWLLTKRGELEPLRLNNQVAEVRPVTPLSKAADMEDAQLAIQFLEVLRADGQPLDATIDKAETFSNLQKKFGDTVVKVLSQEESEARAARIMAMATESRANVSVDT
ncbi:MAG: hypothetical protein JKP96_06675 [Oceanicaulis sp.]|jgi:hypothetical protein|nr:hypothetical protein [Oceanicaulis sp.]